jgi:putative Mg2+ transporter-C (MgtC) family protein
VDSVDINWQEVVYHLYQLGIAFLLALPVALNREHESKGAGLRTFPLVAVASCAYMLVGTQVYDAQEPEARVMYGIITGMGFIGGGAILKEHRRVAGTATAAGIWNTGAIGISVAYSHYEIAIVLSGLSFFIFQFARPLKRPLRGSEDD